MTSQTYYSPFFPATEEVGKKGTTIAVVPTDVIGAINGSIGDINTSIGTIQSKLDAFKQELDETIAENTPDTEAPAIPTGVAGTSTLTDAGADLQFTWNANNESDLAGYDIRISQNGSAYISYQTTTPKYKFVAQPRNVQYSVLVRAFDTSGNYSGFTPQYDISTTRDTVPPGKGFVNAVEVAYSTANIIWTNGTENDLDRAVIRLFNQAGGLLGTKTVAAAKNGGSLIWTQLTKATSYSASVEMIDTSGNSSGQSSAFAFTMAGGIAFADFAPNLAPISTVTTLPNPSGYAGPSVVFNVTDGKLYRYKNGAWTKEVDNSDLATNAITTDKLVDNAVISTKLADNIISTQKLIDGAISTIKIAASAITNDKINNGAITEVKISDNSISAGKIQANAIIAEKIAADTITAREIAALAITTSELAAGSVVADKIAANAVTANAIISSAITTDKLASNSITSDKILANQITANKIVLQNRPISLAGANIRIDAVGNLVWDTHNISKVEDSGAVSLTTVGSGTIGYPGTPVQIGHFGSNNYFDTGANIFDDQRISRIAIWAGGSNLTVFAGVGTIINGDRIVTGTINASKIMANSITADQILAGTIGAAQIAAGAILADKIAAGAVTSEKITVGTLNGDRITTGTLDADRIKANSVLAGSVVVSGTSGTIADAVNRASDPAARVNANSTLINPGRILLQGGTTIDYWRDQTDIRGGAIKTNSITAEKLTINTRGITVNGIDFTGRISDNQVIWTSGTIGYVDDNGNYTTVNVTGGNFQWPETGRALYVYWDKGATSLGFTGTFSDLATGSRICLASYIAGGKLTVNYGGTIIDGDRITTGTINANRIVAGTITAAQIAGTTITGDKIAALAITADKVNVGSLSAITANIGFLVSYNGAGGRVERDGNGTRVYGNNGVLRVKIGF